MCLLGALHIDAVLLAVFKLQDSTYFLVQGFQQLQSFGGTPIVNEYDCARLNLTTTIFITPGKKIKRAVSIAHECDTRCCFKQTQWKTLNVKKLCSQNLYLNMTGATHLIVLTCIVCFEIPYVESTTVTAVNEINKWL